MVPQVSITAVAASALVAPAYFVALAAGCFGPCLLSLAVRG